MFILKRKRDFRNGMRRSASAWGNLADFLVPDSTRQRISDPWHRLSALANGDLLSLVEFSEIHGPQSVLHVPPNPGPHFDDADFSLWLMSTDYLCAGSKCRSTSTFPCFDVTIAMHNEEQGIHTLAHYFALRDVAARGFIRPVTLAFSTSDPAKLDGMIGKLMPILAKLANLLKVCNRRHFVCQITTALDLLSSAENAAVSSYYELYYGSCSTQQAQAQNAETHEPCASDAQSRNAPVLSKRDMRIRRLRRELEQALKASQCDENGQSTFQCQRNIAGDYDTSWISAFLHPAEVSRNLSNSQSDCGQDAIACDNREQKVLRSIQSLCPCVWTKFETVLRATRAHFASMDYFDFYPDFEKHLAGFSLQPAIQVTEGTQGHFTVSRTAPAVLLTTSDRKSAVGNNVNAHQSGDFSDEANLLGAECSSFCDVCGGGLGQILRDDINLCRRCTDSDDLDAKFRPQPSTSGQLAEADNNLLCSMLPHGMPHALFPLWAGQFLLVAAGGSRIQVGRLVTSRFQKVVPCVPNILEQCCEWQRPLTPWFSVHELAASHFNMIIDSALMQSTSLSDSPSSDHAVASRHFNFDSKLLGVAADRKTGLDELMPGSLKRFISVLDLNADALYTRPNAGRLLMRRFSTKTKTSFSHDSSLLAYIQCILAEYCIAALLLYYCDFEISNLLNPRSYGDSSNGRSKIAKVARLFKMNRADAAILRYLVEFLISGENSESKNKSDDNQILLGEESSQENSQSTVKIWL